MIRLADHDFEADAVADILKNVKADGRGAVKKWVAKHSIIGGASLMYQHANGLRPVSLEQAVQYAVATEQPLRKISQRHADTILQLAARITDSAHTAREPDTVYTLAAPPSPAPLPLPIDVDIEALRALPERALGRIEGYIAAQIEAHAAAQARPNLLAASGP